MRGKRGYLLCRLAVRYVSSQTACTPARNGRRGGKTEVQVPSEARRFKKAPLPPRSEEVGHEWIRPNSVFRGEGLPRTEKECRKAVHIGFRHLCVFFPSRSSASNQWIRGPGPAHLGSAHMHRRGFPGGHANQKEACCPPCPAASLDRLCRLQPYSSSHPPCNAMHAA